MTTDAEPYAGRPRAEAIATAMHDLAVDTFPDQADAAFQALMGGISLGLAMQALDPEWAGAAYLEIAADHAEGMVELGMKRTAVDHRMGDFATIEAIKALAEEYAAQDALNDFGAEDGP